MRELCLISVFPRECELPAVLLAGGLSARGLALWAGMLPVSTLETLPLCSQLQKATVGEVAQPVKEVTQPSGHHTPARPSPGHAEHVLSGTFPSPTLLAEMLLTRRPEVG